MSQDSGTIRTSRIIKGGRRPTTVEGRRECIEDDCKTILSRYNTKDRCHQHRAVRFPRVRGVVPT
jgi:hypothetical protein